MYRKAREAWVQVAAVGKVYMSDVTVGEEPQQRGHWTDRLPAIDKDIAAVAELETTAAGAPEPHVVSAIQEALGRPRRVVPAAQHDAPAKFRAGQPLELVLTLAQKDAAVRMYYRHVDQAERYAVVEMEGRRGTFSATIPGAYTDSEYPLEYYFEVRESAGAVTLFPGFSDTLTNQPYFVVRRA
jgi:hypothetical protein